MPNLGRHVSLLTGLVLLAWGGAAAQPALAGTLCVGTVKSGCFSTVQAAVDAAANGDTIRIEAGTFEGAIAIDKDVQLVGSSSSATVIQGGGPVIRVGDGTDTPSVSLSRMTITGGLNDSVPFPEIASGGGLLIAVGATVSLTDSIVTGNRATPSATLPPELCGHVCAFAAGAGIDNAGTLTVTRTRISGNVAGATGGDGSLASDADGGGIDNEPSGTMILRQSVVTGNRAAVTTPYGRNTDGGGIVDGGTLLLQNSAVVDNSSLVTAAVPSSFPSDIEQVANAGALWVSPDASATIVDSTLRGNLVSAFNGGGDAQAENGGIDADAPLTVIGSSIDHNSVRATVPASSGLLAGATGGGVEVEVTGTIRDSRISSNSVLAESASGIANAGGAGIFNFSGHLTVERTLVTENSSTADGAGGLLVGSGILNLDGSVLGISHGSGPPELTLTDSAVTANSLTGGPGIDPQGGGIFSVDILGSLDPLPVTLVRTVIRGNKPDQCIGGC
jgi:hypothetical protein